MRFVKTQKEKETDTEKRIHTHIQSKMIRCIVLPNLATTSL